MKVLIAVSGNDSKYTDPIAAVNSFPWPVGTLFRILTVTAKVHPPIVELIPGALDVSDVQQKADSLAGTISSTAAAQLQSRGFSADSISMEGEPKSTIVDYAKEWGADLIVVGSSDRPRIETFFVGSVSQSVVKHSHCSVLIVKA